MSISHWGIIPGVFNYAVVWHPISFDSWCRYVGDLQI